jgi:hypothetical protein
MYYDICSIFGVRPDAAVLRGHQRWQHTAGVRLPPLLAALPQLATAGALCNYSMLHCVYVLLARHMLHAPAQSLKPAPPATAALHVWRCGAAAAAAAAADM